MKGLLEDRHTELEQAGDTAGEIELVFDQDADLRDLATRCRELLAQRRPRADCPPGHWLG
jgi:hypothetical protein